MTSSYKFVRETLRDCIDRKISPEPNSGCWLWTGAVGSHGYGQVGKTPEFNTTVVHKILYEEKFGPVPDGLELDHLCRVRCCVNPDHLEPVTRRENIMRGIAPSALQAKQSECKNGHPLSGDNLRTYKTKYGIGRKCKICAEQWLSENHERVKARMRQYYYEHKGRKA